MTADCDYCTNKLYKFQPGPEKMGVRYQSSYLPVNFFSAALLGSRCRYIAANHIRALRVFGRAAPFFCTHALIIALRSARTNLQVVGDGVRRPRD